MTERVLGDIGTRIVYEDDRVRVWQLELAPGESGPVHRHELDHLLIQISGDRIAAFPEPDTEGPFHDHIEADVVPGVVVAGPARRGRAGGRRGVTAVPGGHRGAEGVAGWSSGSSTASTSRTT